MNLTDLTIAEADQGLKTKKFSAVELAKACLDRIAQTDKTLHAFVTVTPEEALQQAKATDERIAKDKRTNPLDGIPVAFKDIFCRKGVETTACSRILKGFKPPYDATSVRQLREAGAVMLGMTNMDEFACGASTEHSCYGVTKNPWNTEKVAGGSSGGSVAAVSSGQTLYSLGTDTGGSTRQPAALCNLTSIRVTYGLTSRSGVMAMASSWDTINPITRDVQDLAIVLNALAHKDPRDATTIDRPEKDYTKPLTESVKGLTLGIPKEYFGEGVEPEVQEIVMAGVKQLESLGIKTKPVSLPMTKYAVACYYVSIPSELSANLARFDGIRFGPGPIEKPADLQEYYYTARSEGFGDEIKRRIMIGTYALSSGYYDAYYLKAQKVRTLITRDFERVFKEVDAVVAPTSPFPAFGIGEKVNDPLAMYLADVFTIPACAAGIPALAIPCGFTQSGLPVGFQFLGPQKSEARLISLTHAYQQSTDWHKKRPSI